MTEILIFIESFKISLNEFFLQSISTLSSREKSLLEEIHACLMISEYPLLNSKSLNVFRKEKSIKRNSGSFIVPIIFLIPLKFTPFLPPIEASVIDKSVVGTNPNLTPLI